MAEHYVHFLHTNDLHSHFDNLPRLVHKMQDLRRKWRQRGDVVLTIDVGDHLDRMHLITEGTMGKANVDLLAATGVDMITLGNNEGLTLPKQQLSQMYAGNPFPVVLSNLVDYETGNTPPWITPFLLKTIAGVRFGFIGLTIDFNDFYNLLGWRVLSPLAVAKSWIAAKKNEVDIWVVLSHLGIRYDFRLAELLPAGSLILGSHTHNVLPRGELVHQVLIAQAGKFGDYLGHVAVALDPARRRVSQVNAELFPNDQGEDSAEIALLIKKQEEIAEREMANPILELTQSLEIDYQEESPLANLLADGLLDWVEGADFALVNSGQLLHPLHAGVITRKLIHEACPAPINPCSMLIKGEDVRILLEETLMPEYQGKTIRGFGFRGKVLGLLGLSGIQVEYDPQGKPYQRIRNILVDGVALRDDEEYRVATIDMFSFGAGHERFLQARDVRYLLPEFLRDILQWQLVRTGSFERCRKKRWIPVKRNERGEKVEVRR